LTYFTRIRLRAFSSSIPIRANFKNLDDSQSLLVCQDKHFPYFQNFIAKSLPKKLQPILVPMSLASTCGYKDQKIQSAFSPLQSFILNCKGDTCPYKYFAAAMKHGKGRGQNKWESHCGGLMFSYTSKGKLADSVYLPYLDSLCLAKALKPHVPDVTIKWPNDILIKGKKIAGIICNAAGNLSQSDNCSMVHGIGLNFSNKEPTTCVCNFTDKLTIPGLLDSFHRELDYYLYMLENEGFEGIRKEYMNHWMHE
jgi:biotin-[acetyl-CoA-carboxylase] ligase BirA-like protein